MAEKWNRRPECAVVCSRGFDPGGPIMMVRRGLNEEEEANSGGQSASDAAGSGKADSVSAKVEDVLEAAERAAAAIREEASEWASKHMEDARREADQMAGERARELSRLAKELIAGASVVIKQSDEFLRGLDQTAVTAADNGATVREDGANVQAKESAEGVDLAQDPSASPPDTESPISDGARLLAARMAVAETPRDEIAQRLQDEFGIQDAGPLLDRMGI